MSAIKINIKKKRSLEYFNILMIFLPFFIIFVITSITIMANTSHNSHEKLKTETSLCVAQTVDNINSFMAEIYELSYNFLSNDYITRLLPSTASLSTEESLDIISLVNFISNFRHSLSNDIYHVTLYSDGERVYNDSGMFNFNLYFDELFKHKTNTSKTFLKIHEISNTMAILPADVISEKYSAYKDTVVLPIVVSKDIDNKNWTLLTEVDSSYFKKLLQKSSTVEGQNFCVYDKFGNTILNTTGYDFSKNKIDELLSFVDVDRQITLDNYKVGGKSYQLAGATSTQGISCFILTQNNAINLATFKNNQFMLFFFLFTMVIFFILTMVFTHRLYSPMQNIIDLVKQTDDTKSVKFPNLKAYIEQLSKLGNIYSIKEGALTDSLDDCIRRLVFLGKTFEYGDFKERFFANTGIKENDLSCLTIKIQFHDVYYETYNEEERKMVNNGLKLILAGVLSKRFNIYIVEYVTNSFVCLFNGYKNNHNEFTSAINELCSILSYDSNYCSLIGGFSGDGFEISDSNTLYNTIMDSLTALDFNENGDEFVVEEYNAEKVCFKMDYSMQDRNKLVNLLKARDIDGVWETVDGIFKKNKNNHLHHTVMQMMISLMYDIGKEFVMSFTNDSEVAADILYEFNEIAQTAAYELHPEPQALKQFFSHCIDIVLPIESNAQNIDNVLSYIVKNYSKELYPELIAKEVKMSPRYLSRIFKEKIGINVNEYIALVRINKAKELLISSSMNVINIGEQVGFETRTTFFRTFKKLEGISPNEYRKSNKNV